MFWAYGGSSPLVHDPAQLVEQGRQTAVASVRLPQGVVVHPALTLHTGQIDTSNRKRKKKKTECVSHVGKLLILPALHQIIFDM